MLSSTFRNVAPLSINLLSLRLAPSPWVGTRCSDDGPIDRAVGLDPDRHAAPGRVLRLSLRAAAGRAFRAFESNSLEPGWVPTKMGGTGAPDDIDKAHRTQAWLATSNGNQPRQFPEATSFIRGFGIRIRLRWMSSGRICCSTWAADFQVQLLPRRGMLANRFRGLRAIK